MPLHDYSCDAGHKFERFVSIASLDVVQKCECGEVAHRLVCAPRVVSDDIEPIRGPDGKMHTSRASLNHACSPDGNRTGQQVHWGEVEPAKFEKPKFDKRKRREAIHAGIQDVKEGRVAPVVVGDLP